jgi:hypothetical protein
MVRSFARSFVLILTRDNGSEPKKVCKRCDLGYLRGGRVASDFVLHTLRPPVSSALSAKRRLHRTSSDGEGGTTRGIRGRRVGRRRDKGDLMGEFGPGDLAADGVDSVEMKGTPRGTPA